MSYTNRWQHNNWGSATGGDYGSRWAKDGTSNRWQKGNYDYERWFGSSQYYDDLLSKAALAQEALSQPEHGGAKLHVFFDPPVTGIVSTASASRAEVRTTLWVYTDKQEIKDNINMHIDNI